MPNESGYNSHILIHNREGMCDAVDLRDQQIETLTDTVAGLRSESPESEDLQSQISGMEQKQPERQLPPNSSKGLSFADAAELKFAMNRKTAQIRMLKHKIERLSRENEEYNQQMTAIESEVQQIKSAKAEGVETQHRSCQTSKSKVGGVSKLLMEKQDRLLEQMESLKKTVSEKERLETAKSDELETLRSEIKEKDRVIEQLNTELDAFRRHGLHYCTL